MPDKPMIDILEARCRLEDEKIVDRWYDEFHIPVLLGTGKLRSVARYKAVGTPPGTVRFFTICRYDSLKDFKEFLACPEFAAAGEKSAEMKSVKMDDSPPVHCVLVKEWKR